MRGLAECVAPVATLVGKTWDLHIEKVTRVSREENLRMIEESVAFLVAQGKEVVYDAEHFFDAYEAHPGYALDCLRAAEAGGAAWITPCDTNGATLPGAPRRGRCARCARPCPAPRWASTPTTTPSARWPTASPPSTRARGWCRARSTATASAAATPT